MYLSESAIPSEKNAANRVEIDQQTATQCVFELCTPRTHGAPDSERDKKKLETRNKSIVPSRTMHTGRMSGHNTEKGVHYYVNNYHA